MNNKSLEVWKILYFFRVELLSRSFFSENLEKAPFLEIHFISRKITFSLF